MKSNVLVGVCTKRPFPAREKLPMKVFHRSELADAQSAIIEYTDRCGPFEFAEERHGVESAISSMRPTSSAASQCCKGSHTNNTRFNSSGDHAPASRRFLDSSRARILRPQIYLIHNAIANGKVLLKRAGRGVKASCLELEPSCGDSWFVRNRRYVWWLDGLMV
jgi:hypothetical protein